MIGLLIELEANYFIPGFNIHAKMKKLALKVGWRILTYKNKNLSILLWVNMYKTFPVSGSITGNRWIRLWISVLMASYNDASGPILTSFLTSSCRTPEMERNGLIFYIFERLPRRHTSPRLELVLLELVHRWIGRLVVHLQDLDEVGDRQHADEFLPLRVPEWCRPDAIVDECVKCLLDE